MSVALSGRMRQLWFCLFLFGCSSEPLPAAQPDLLPAKCAFQPFVDCGCGCCGGVEPAEVCVHSSRGETLESLRGNSTPPTAEQCASAGCSPGTRYLCCE